VSEIFLDRETLRGEVVLRKIVPLPTIPL